MIGRSKYWVTLRPHLGTNICEIRVLLFMVLSHGRRFLQPLPCKNRSTKQKNRKNTFLMRSWRKIRPLTLLRCTSVAAHSSRALTVKWHTLILTLQPESSGAVAVAPVYVSLCRFSCGVIVLFLFFAVNFYVASFAEILSRSM